MMIILGLGVYIFAIFIICRFFYVSGYGERDDE